MSVTFGFFDSVNGDRIYNSNDFSNYFKGLIGNGIYKDFLGGLQVVADSSTALGLIVKPGKATIDGRWLLNDSEMTLTLNPGGTTTRIDFVVVQLNLTERTMSIKVISQQEYKSNDSASIKNLSLAKIRIPKNATSILPTYITDLRPVSGFVTGLIDQVDTEELFTQYQNAIEEKEAEFDAYFAEKQAAFNSWFERLTSDLIVNTTINEYRNTITTESEVKGMHIGVAEYSKGDIVDIHLNGVWLIRNKDFTIDDSGMIEFTQQISAGDTIDVRVLKSEIGDSILTDSGDILFI